MKIFMIESDDKSPRLLDPILSDMFCMFCVIVALIKAFMHL